MQIVGRQFTHAQFRTYVEGLTISPWAKFIVVHNTSVPDIKKYRDDWMKRPPTKWNPEQWMRNLVSFYVSQNFKGTPHLFIPPVEDRIFVLNALTVPGTHSPSWNTKSIGVEVVGEFEREPFDGPTRANTVAALATLHQKLGLRPDGFSLGVRGLHLHKEDAKTTHVTCPGRNLKKDDLVRRVLEAMGHEAPVAEADDHVHVPGASQEADTHGMSVQELTSMKWVQTMLNRWRPAFLLTVDGDRGPKTKAAVEAFQRSFGLVVDGIPGPVTRATLKQKVK